jgi:deoxyribodipyrimidine photo-lyase
VNESLVELDRELRLRGGCLTILRGPLPAVFESLYAELGGFDALWSHEKTGLDRTRARDRRVAAWCRERGVRWTEVPQTGVVRGLRDRDGWAARWRERMTAPLVDPPERIPAADAPPGTLGTPLFLPGRGWTAVQRRAGTFLLVSLSDLAKDG